MIAVTVLAWGTFSLVIIAALAYLVKMTLHLWRGVKGLSGALSGFGEAVDGAMRPIRDDLERINEGLARIADNRRS